MESEIRHNRRPPLGSPCPPPPVPAPESGGEDGGCGLLEARGEATAKPPAAGVAGSRVFWNISNAVWAVVGWLSISAALVFLISGAYKPHLAFLSSTCEDSPALQPHNGSAVDAYPYCVPSASQSTAQMNEDQKHLDEVLNNVAALTPQSVPSTRSNTSSVDNTPSPSGPSSSLPRAASHDDKFFGGLLAAAGFDEGACLSRLNSYVYRKVSPFRPSPYLLQRLRKYEALHRRCAPPTSSYKRSLSLLNAGSRVATAGAPCKYVILYPENGLGNRMLSVASAFLYALLSGRVLLVADWSADLSRLFCEPFPASTWLLPQDFPLQRQNYSKISGNHLKRGTIGDGGSSAPAYVYAHLSHDYDDNDKRFYCEADQLLLEKIPWIALKSDQYFVPALFTNPPFERELVRLFPKKEAVFHLLGRYLFHPSNVVWGVITSYYRDHLAAAKGTLGIQIRMFDQKFRPFHLILRQILNCTLSEKLLPEVDVLRHASPATGGGPSRAVLLASLHSVFYDGMKGMYSEHPAAGGEAVSFHQPSHEEEQRKGSVTHDGKALVDMYLLSLADALVTSSRSTFGYVAQSLAGTRPWVLGGPVHESVPEPACARDMSPEPCFHFPPDYDCETGAPLATTKLLPYTRRCKDFRRGIKLVDDV